MAKKKPIAVYSDNISSYFSHDMHLEMERAMYRGAGRRHSSEDNLNNGYIKPRDESYSDCAKRDAIRAFHRAGLGPHSGADNEKEDLEYAKEMRMGVKTQSNKKSKRK